MPDPAPDAAHPPAPIITSAAALAALLRGAGEDAYSPLGPHAALCLDLTTITATPPWVAARLANFPVPVIGFGNATHPLAALCDTVRADARATLHLAARARQSPHAASVLAHTLRLIAQLPPAAALTVESLAYATLQNAAQAQAWRAAHPIAPQAPSPNPPLSLSHDGPSLAITLTRPDRHNAIDTDLRDALCEAFDLAALDDQIASLTLTAAGRAFCTGGALWEFGHAPDPATAHAVRTLRLPAARLLAAGKPLRVHVQGACIGAGLELAAFASHLTASKDAWFHLPEIAMGLIPGAGGTLSLSRRLGRHAAFALILAAPRLTAPAALAIGLIDAII